jgi:hypothetical protein
MMIKLLLTVSILSFPFTVGYAEDVFEDSMAGEFFSNPSLTIVILIIVLLSVGDKVRTVLRNRKKNHK